MRSVFVFMALLSLVLLPCLGCGGGVDTPDERGDDPAFVESQDPTMNAALPEDPSDDPAAGAAAPAEE